MEAKDLMIGDWVYRPDCYDQVKEIRQNGIIGLDSLRGLIGFSEIEPIHLTPEILEKNGFVNVENTQTSTIIYSFRDSLFRIGVFDFNHITMDSYYTDSSCDIFISSVHELQHALRLCGIKKEIIL